MAAGLSIRNQRKSIEMEEATLAFEEQVFESERNMPGVEFAHLRRTVIHIYRYIATQAQALENFVHIASKTDAQIRQSVMNWQMSRAVMWKRWRRLHLAWLHFLIIPKRRMLIKGGKTVMSCPSSLQYFCLGVRDGPIWRQCSEHTGAGVAMAFCLALLIAGQQYGIGGTDF